MSLYRLCEEPGTSSCIFLLGRIKHIWGALPHVVLNTEEINVFNAKLVLYMHNETEFKGPCCLWG